MVEAVVERGVIEEGDQVIEGTVVAGPGAGEGALVHLEVQTTI